MAKLVGVILLAALMAGAAYLSVRADPSDKAPRMTKEQVLPLIGSDDVTIFDVRLTRDWESSPTKIKGAIRLDPMDAKAMMQKVPKDKTLVFYCD